MKIGIIGLPQTGKSTVFDLLQGQAAARAAFDPEKGRVGTIKVPDSRVDRLSKLFNPRKTTYSDIEFVDFALITRGTSARSALTSKLLSEIKTVDGLLHVVRFFTDENVYHVKDGVNPVRDYRLLMSELLLADLMLVEQRQEKIRKNVERGLKKDERELGLLSRLKEALEGELPASAVRYPPEDEGVMKSYALVTAKPAVTVLNVDEAAVGSPGELARLASTAEFPPGRTITLSARVEAEIAGLDTEEERTEFLRDLGMSEPARTRLIRTCYEMLEYISFFTVGEDEVRAWTIRAGTNAQKAAGKIHSDLETGFIRAEVVGYDDFARLEGSTAAARKEGVYRLEGKDYIVRDGDILNIRFNV